MKDYVVTPWEVKGDVDYDDLIKRFGTEKISPKLLKRFEKAAGGSHVFLRRKLYFSHRDLGWILDEYEKGNPFVLYTGRGPSGHTHIGHLIPFIFTQWLQERFDVPLYFQMTDDEKFLVKENLSLEDTRSFAYDNALDVIACGFDPKKTKIFANTEYIKTLYRTALKVADRVTFSTARAVFGFENSTNIGQIFFPALQAVPSFLESLERGENVPCLIPCAIDQDPYWRITRDVAPKLGFYKPAAIHNKFVPGLGKGGKMSASKPETCIFSTDEPEEAKKKVMKAFTGGRVDVEEQKKKGGDPEICSVFAYYATLFEKDDKKLAELHRRCKAGDILCGECKSILAERVADFLEEHQKKREKAKSKLDDFMVKD